MESREPKEELTSGYGRRERERKRETGERRAKVLARVGGGKRDKTEAHIAAALKGRLIGS